MSRCDVVGGACGSGVVRPHGETALNVQLIHRKYPGLGCERVTVRWHPSVLGGAPPAVRTGFFNLVKDESPMGSASSIWLAIRELLLIVLVFGGLGEVSGGQTAWTTEMGFGVRCSVAIR